jgi:hypothetical protein
MEAELVFAHPPGDLASTLASERHEAQPTDGVAPDHIHSRRSPYHRGCPCPIALVVLLGDRGLRDRECLLDQSCIALFDFRSRGEGHEPRELRLG